MKNVKLFIKPLALFLGLIIGAFILGHSIERFRQEERYITVKGFSEKEVKADLAIWTMTVRVANNDLVSGSNLHSVAKKQVVDFLVEKGIKPSEITISDLTVMDMKANEYGGNYNPEQLRYIIEEKVQVRSGDVDKVQQISRMTSELLKAGVALSTKNDWRGSGLRFIFTKLNDVKPAMIADAIQNAREAAEQFTKESATKLGSIRNANQGLFSIMDRDESLNGAGGGSYNNSASDIYKRIRVVITVDYNLKHSGIF
jgi:uncharacterized protein